MAENILPLFLHKLTLDYRTAPIELEKNVHYLLNCDTTLPPLHIRWHSSFFSLNASLGTTPPTMNNAAFWLHCMQANFLGHGIGECSLGTTLERADITISLTIYHEIDYTIFKEKLEQFLNMQNYWSDKLKSFDSKHV